MRPWVGHPDYVYTPLTADQRLQRSLAHKRRLGIPPDCVSIFGVHVPQQYAVPLKHWANWVRCKHGLDKAAAFVSAFIENGHTIEKPSPPWRKADWGLVDELMAENMSRAEIAEFFDIKLWYLQEQMFIRKRLGRSIFGAGRRPRRKAAP